MHKRTKCFLIVMAILILLFSGCGTEEKATDSMVANVGGLTISEDDLIQYVYLYAFVNTIDVASLEEEDFLIIKSMILEDLIAIKLMELKHMDDSNLPRGDFEAEAEDFVAKVHSEETANAYMSLYGVTDDALRDFYISQFYSATYFETLRQDVSPATEEEIQIYYEENLDVFDIDEITARHILVEEEELARDLLADLKRGEDFGVLAREHSIDKSAENGGYLGTFGRNAMIPEFEEAAFALPKGGISDVVSTKFGYHIIYVEDKRQGMEAFEEAKENIEKILQSSRISDLYLERIEEMTEEFGVIYGEGYGKEQTD